MNVLYGILMVTVAILLVFLVVEEAAKLFKEDKPAKKKRAVSIEEARDMLWKGYTNAYFDFD